MSGVPFLVNKLLGSQCKKLLDFKTTSVTRQIFTSFVLSQKVSFKLSDIGEGIREVVVKEWFVNVGDKVIQFDNICEVQSDKASVTITSRYDGVITKLHYKIDDIALVGQPLVDLETDDIVGESATVAETKTIEHASTPVSAQPSSATTIKADDVAFSISSSSSDENPVLCIPSVRRLAKEHKVNLTQVKGTGKHGRILKEDILKFLADPPIVTPLLFENNVKVEPIKGFTKAMVKTMTEALKIPHFVYSDEIAVTKLSKLRQELKNLPNLDVKLTFLPFFIKATSNALQRYPIINSSVDEKCENIIYKKQHNIGIAMDTNQGLAVPVVKNVEQLNILEIAKELQRLIASGKNGAFAPSDLSGATFSISNIGIVGGTYTKPVILPPQVAIIAIGMTQVLPRFDEAGNIVKEEIINISGSADHRIIDGVSMANFIKTLKLQIENPNLLFLNL